VPSLSFFIKLKSLINQTPILQSLFGLSKRIIKVIPFYLVVEGFADENKIELQPRMNKEDLMIALVDKARAKALSQHPEVPKKEAMLLRDLPDYWHCIGIWHKEEIIAYMLCNIQKLDSTHYSFRLKEDEAYLTYARTFNAYRGKNLAPYLRCKLYEHLRNIGRNKMYSITEYFNDAARRFKQKLDVKPSKLIVSIYFLNKYKINIPLKSFKVRGVSIMQRETDNETNHDESEGSEQKEIDNENNSGRKNVVRGLGRGGGKGRRDGTGGGRGRGGGGKGGRWK
jgi:uncharacterized membrane protein YgcG